MIIRVINIYLELRYLRFRALTSSPAWNAKPARQLPVQMLDAFLFLGLDLIVSERNNSNMLAKNRTIESRGRKWKVWVVDETDVTITVRVRPLRIMTPIEFTLPFRDEFSSFDSLAAEVVDRYLEAQRCAKLRPSPLPPRGPWHSTHWPNYSGEP